MQTTKSEKYKVLKWKTDQQKVTEGWFHKYTNDYLL